MDDHKNDTLGLLETPYLNQEMQELQVFPLDKEGFSNKIDSSFLTNELLDNQEFEEEVVDEVWEEQEFSEVLEEELIEHQCSCSENELISEEVIDNDFQYEFEENLDAVSNEFLEDEEEILTYETLIAIDDEIEEDYELIDYEFEDNLGFETVENFIASEDYELDEEIDTVVWNEEYFEDEQRIKEAEYDIDTETYETEEVEWEQGADEGFYENHVEEPEWRQENHIEYPLLEDAEMYNEELYTHDDEVVWEEVEEESEEFDEEYNEWEEVEEEYQETDEEFNERELVEDQYENELEEDYFGFTLWSTPTVTFPSDISLSTVAGPEYKGQEFYDPSNSGNPLLDTGRKNRRKKLSKNFSVYELARAQRGRYKFYKARIDPELVECLQKLRTFLYDKPVTVIDGYYSYKYLKKLIGASRATKSKSPHLSGQGAKIRVRGMSGVELAKAIVIACGKYVGVSMGTSTAAIYVKQPEAKITSYIGNKSKRRAARAAVKKFRELIDNKPPSLEKELDEAYRKLKRSIVETKMRPGTSEIIIPWENLRNAALYLRQEMQVRDPKLVKEILFYTDVVKMLRYHREFNFIKTTKIRGPYWNLCKGIKGYSCIYEKDDWLSNHLYKSFNRDKLNMDNVVWEELESEVILPIFGRPASPVSQKAPLDKGSKGERVLADEKPDNPRYNITGRYEVKYSGSGKFTGTTICINQAGNHIEGVLADVSSPDSTYQGKNYFRIYGDLKNNGSFSVFVRKNPKLHFTLIPKGNHIVLKRKGARAYTFRKISYTPILMEVALYKQPPLLKSYEWFPLLTKQKERIIRYFGDHQKIDKFLKKFHSVGFSLKHHKEKLQAIAVSNFDDYVSKAVSDSNYGIHSSDIVLASFYIRTLLSNSKWRPSSSYPYLTQLDWIQRMVSIDVYNRDNTYRQGGYSAISSIKEFVGIDPSWSKGVNPDTSFNVYKVSLKISGATAFLVSGYKGKITVEKTDRRKWPGSLKKVTFNITLGGLGLGAGIKANSTMQGEVASPIYWVPHDFPGWVDVAFGGGSISARGVGGSAIGGFIHIKGRGNLPVLQVVFGKKGISPSKNKFSAGVQLTGLKGKIHDKNMPVNLDFLSIKVKTDYSVIYNLNKDVHFALGSAILTEPARQAIRIMCAHELVGLTNSRSELKIIAHTDRVDTHKRNLALSAMRAANVQQAIEDILGNKLKARFTKVTGKGEAEAAKTDDDEDENAKYRRVDIFLNTRLVLRLNTK